MPKELRTVTTIAAAAAFIVVPSAAHADQDPQPAQGQADVVTVQYTASTSGQNDPKEPKCWEWL